MYLGKMFVCLGDITTDILKQSALNTVKENEWHN